MLDSELETAALRIVSVETVTPGGSGVAGAAEPSFALTGIEWYGKQVEQLDAIHSGKVTLTGAGAEKLAKHDALDSQPKG